jgi:hypothetical protein
MDGAAKCHVGVVVDDLDAAREYLSAQPGFEGYWAST